MHKYEHKILIEKISQADATPQDNDVFADWIQAGDHLRILNENELENEFIAYASGPFSFVLSVVVPVERLSPPDIEDLLSWQVSLSGHRCSYVSGSGIDGVRVENGFFCPGSRTLNSGQHLVFYRRFEGWKGDDRAYIEVLQEFAHLANVHWSREQGAYCKINDEGDIDAVVSVSLRDMNPDEVALVSFARSELDEFLAASRLAVVRLFDFTLFRRRRFHGWKNLSEQKRSLGEGLHYRQHTSPGHGGYTRGIQLIFPRGGYEAGQRAILDRRSARKPTKFVEFTALDWRNHNKVRRISTDPSATTNYFDAKSNELPYELSPAFFKPEVLSKYKSDKDKYTVDTRQIICRGGWSLRGIDVNEAGQVHAYICDLRDLPYNEQLHWLSHNERPKASISRRAFTTDFKGEISEEVDPLDSIKSRLRYWWDARVEWWYPTQAEVFARAIPPHGSSRDEWANSFVDLSQLVIEGFRLKAIRKALDGRGVTYQPQDQSIKLLERLWEQMDPVNSRRFDALRTIQNIRTKARGHSGSSEARDIAKLALEEHGSFAAQFDKVCDDLDSELEFIFHLFEKHDTRVPPGFNPPA